MVEKYGMLLQDADTAVALQKKELDTYYEIVLKNKLLAEVLIHNHEKWKSEAVQFTEQGMHCA